MSSKFASSSTSFGGASPYHARSAILSQRRAQKTALNEAVRTQRFRQQQTRVWQKAQAVAERKAERAERKERQDLRRLRPHLNFPLPPPEVKFKVKPKDADQPYDDLDEFKLGKANPANVVLEAIKVREGEGTEEDRKKWWHRKPRTSIQSLASAANETPRLTARVIGQIIGGNPELVGEQYDRTVVNADGKLWKKSEVCKPALLVPIVVQLRADGLPSEPPTHTPSLAELRSEREEFAKQVLIYDEKHGEWVTIDEEVVARRRLDGLEAGVGGGRLPTVVDTTWQNVHGDAAKDLKRTAERYGAPLEGKAKGRAYAMRDAAYGVFGRAGLMQNVPENEQKYQRERNIEFLRVEDAELDFWMRKFGDFRIGRGVKVNHIGEALAVFIIRRSGRTVWIDEALGYPQSADERTEEEQKHIHAVQRALHEVEKRSVSTSSIQTAHTPLMRKTRAAYNRLRHRQQTTDANPAQ
jgi:hypothetical protein